MTSSRQPQQQTGLLQVHGCRVMQSLRRYARVSVPITVAERILVLLQVWQLQGNELKLAAEREYPHPLKCGTFGASSLSQRHLATGNFEGKLQIFDLERLAVPTFSAQAHAGIINQVDGAGGKVSQGGCAQSWWQLRLHAVVGRPGWGLPGSAHLQGVTIDQNAGARG